MGVTQRTELTKGHWIQQSEQETLNTNSVAKHNYQPTDQTVVSYRSNLFPAMVLGMLVWTRTGCLDVYYGYFNEVLLVSVMVKNTDLVWTKCLSASSLIQNRQGFLKGRIRTKTQPNLKCLTNPWFTRYCAEIYSVEWSVTILPSHDSRSNVTKTWVQTDH